MTGSIVFFIARLVPSLLAVITTALLTRLLDPAAYGMYALGLSIIFLITIGAFEWLGLSLMRMATTARQQDLFFGTIVSCFCAVSGIAAVVAAGFALFGQSVEVAAFAGACLFAGLASAWIELKQRLQMAELNRKAYFWTSVGRGLASITLITITACIYKTAPPLLFAMGMSALLAGLIYRERRLSLLNFQFDRRVLRDLLRFGLPLSISVGLATILVSIDKWMLQGLSGPQSVGLFSAAALIAQVPVVTLANCIGPYSYSMAVEALEFRTAQAAKSQLEQNFALLLSLVLPGAAGIVALSDNLAHVIVGSAYTDAVIRLAPWLAASAVFSSMRGFYVDTAFQLAHKTTALTWINVIAIVVNLILDFWLIPTAGELGAAMSSFTAILVSLLVASIWSRRIYRLPFPYADTAKIIASTALMFFILQSLTGFAGIPALAGQLIAGLTVYLTAAVTLNVLGIRHHLLARFPQIRRLLPALDSRDITVEYVRKVTLMSPQISVVIPTLKRPELLLRALNSVFSQTYSPIDLVVVVDGPDQETIAALRSISDPRLQVIVNERSLTAAGARNAGVALAKGEWIAFLDDDDEWLPNKLERQMALAQHKGAEFVICLSRVITPLATYVWPETLYDNKRPLDEYMFDRKTAFSGSSFIQTSSYLIRRDTFQQSPFRIDTPHDDWDFVLRQSKLFRVQIETVPEVLTNLYMEEQRPSLSDSSRWRASLDWLDSIRPLLTRRAYSGFCLGVVGPRAAEERAYSAAFPLLVKAFRYGAPRLPHLAAYLAFWTLSRNVRRQLRAVIRGEPKARQQSHKTSPEAE